MASVNDNQQAGLRRAFENFSTYRSTPDKALDLFAQARTGCPVPHSQELGGFHLLLTYEDVRAALMDWRTFGNGPHALRPIAEGVPRLPPIDFDPPEHTAWRNIFNAGINAKTADRIAPLVLADVANCIDRFVGKGECDLVADLAERVPMLALFHVLGLDEGSHEHVRRLTLALLASAADRPRFSQIFAQFAKFGKAEVEKRRIAPRDDYLTTLAEARIDGRLLDEEEIGAVTNSVLLAGHGTTVISMTNLFYEVLSRPRIKQALLADPGLIPAAVEETLRLHTPFFGLYRRVNADTMVNGTELREGESVYLCWQSANRDSTVFEDADDFRLDRDHSRHLTFGRGRHSCTGAATARMELCVALEQLLLRVPDVELIAPETVKAEFRGAETAAIGSLPARFKAQ
ncbi:Cytochrome P450 [Sphingobium faniae]|nr:Cytochrome P450 [Sphingobium faniae]